MQRGAQRRGQKSQNFPCCGKTHGPAPCPPAPATHLGRGGLNPASYSSLPCSRELQHQTPTWEMCCGYPWKRILAAGKSFRKDWGVKKVETGMVPASATPRSCALGEKGRGAWIGGFKSGEEVEQVLGECGRTWEINPENCCREPEILWSARDHATSQEWNHGLSNHFVPPVESCGEQTWKGWAQPGVFTLRSTGREPS